MFLYKKRKKMRFWVLTIRQQKGDFHGLIQELKLYHAGFHTYFRISVGQFELTSEVVEK